MSVRVEHIGDATLILGDCRTVLPSLQGVQAIISDPPYGMGWNTDSTRYSGGHRNSLRRGGRNDWGGVLHDDEPFDPSPLIGYRDVILWGSNHYAAHLPVGTTLVWIKRFDPAFGSFLSDAEIAWQKGGHGVYCKRDLSNTANATNRLHPTQKPLGIMQWCVGRTAGLVLDPYMGSGTTIAACISMGRPCIGIEIDEHYFNVAVRRIKDVYRQPDLFIPPPKQARVDSLPLFADTTGGPR